MSKTDPLDLRARTGHLVDHWQLYRDLNHFLKDVQLVLDEYDRAKSSATTPDRHHQDRLNTESKANVALDLTRPLDSPPKDAGGVEALIEAVITGARDEPYEDILIAAKAALLAAYQAAEARARVLEVTLKESAAFYHDDTHIGYGSFEACPRISCEATRALLAQAAPKEDTHAKA